MPDGAMIPLYRAGYSFVAESPVIGECPSGILAAGLMPLATICA